jgi:O-antigen/teichoic acid export membrane protein
MEVMSYRKNINKIFLSFIFHALFSFLFVFFSYYFLKPKDFSYLTGLFIFEGLLIFFDLTIYNYVIKHLSILKKYHDRQKLISFFFVRLLIFSLLFFLLNLTFIRIFYWDRILINEISIFYGINLSYFVTLIVSFIVIFRILINYLRIILIGSFQQELFSNIQVVSSIIKILTLFLFINNSKSIESILIAYLLGLIIEFLIFFKFSNKIIKFKFNLKKKYLKFPNYLFIFAISNIFFFNVDRIFISYYLIPDEIGKYNFFRVMLSFFFILSISYYYNLFPDISRINSVKKIIKNKIYINFKSLNIILIFILLNIILFSENYFIDFKINNFLEVGNINILKILAIAMYFNIIGIILYSFQVGIFFFKIPSLINIFLIFISIPFFLVLYKPDDSTNVAYIYLFLNICWFFFNLFFLNKNFKKIFSRDILIFFLKNFFINFTVILIILLFLYFLIYNLSKILFYLLIFFCFLFCVTISQRILNKYVY